MVLAGGTSYYGSQSVRESTLVYDVEDDAWSNGPPLPGGLWIGRTVQLETTFLALGGAKDWPQNYNDGTIYEYDPVNLAWREQEDRLLEDKSGFFIMDVPEEVYCFD